MFTKTIVPLALLAGLLSACAGSDNDPTPTPTTPIASTVVVQVSQAGAPSYNLNEARVVSYNYQTGGAMLSLSGKLGDGRLLTLNFSRGTNPPAYSTRALQATLGTEDATNPTGTTTYDPTTHQVDGTFSTTFTGSTGTLTGSFSKLQLP